MGHWACPSSALCPAKLPAPFRTTALGQTGFSAGLLPRHSLVRGRGPYRPALFIWVSAPLSRMPLLPLFSLCMLCLSCTYASVPSLPWDPSGGWMSPLGWARHGLWYLRLPPCSGHC